MNHDFTHEEGMTDMPLKNFNDVLKHEKTPHMDWVSRLADILGTSKFITCLTAFFVCWLGGNVIVNMLTGHTIDPAPFLLASTCINIYSAYTISILLKADKSQRERDALKHQHEYEVNRTTLAYDIILLKELRELRKDIKLKFNKPEQDMEV